ncbi:hypothetical protein Psta_2563 [Pirellula staleyi DSM 6068]|uniref:Uncharacterized protein n=1 Tax=Pirellula staleyi (strain ATCC 27377 / DSM 6068 / ICPB 4128) TaxID=530564 RepID=D2R5Q0_PIRSD|nr:hypothetical protein [Pirellula staleyi]ADB17232.1 hypothetical protein Psta_2563 [Pirellula staleyi DSM 6068]
MRTTQTRISLHEDHEILENHPFTDQPNNNNQASGLEQRISEIIKKLSEQQGELHQFSDGIPELLLSLEWYLPGILAEAHPEWEYQSFDGVYAVKILRPSPLEIHIFGAAILITTQTLVALDVLLEVDQAVDRILYLELRLGEDSPNGMLQYPYTKLNKLLNRIGSLKQNARSIRWAYHVGFGERK